MRWLVVATGFLGILALAGCRDEGVTVYPVILCQRGCVVVTLRGERVTRQFVATSPKIYSAFPATQDVIRQESGVVDSLTRDRKYVCRVRTPRDWECTRERSAPGVSHTLMMNSGALSSLESPLAEQAPITTYIGRCQWNHIGWRNRMGLEDPRGLGGALLGWAAGCVLPRA